MGSAREDTERKARHLDVCLHPETYNVEFGSAGFESIRFVHRSLPEISDDEIDTSIRFLDHRISFPLFISSMTGGSDLGYQINKDLARAAEILGVPVGMGSIRILFRKPEVIDHFQLKKFAPNVPVIGNIGAVHLRDASLAEVVEMFRRLEVQGVAIHLNPGQELFQPGGDRDFRGVLDGIRRYCEMSPLPVIVKETGFGMLPHEVELLRRAGAEYINVAGSGGTNWATVEAHRLPDAEAVPAREFDSWGLPTALVLAALDLRNGEREPTVRINGHLLASGGLRSGMDLAKSLALGASLGGFALPFVRAVASDGVDGVVQVARSYERVLRSVMLLTGSRTTVDLMRAPLLIAPAFSEQARSLATFR